MTEQLKEIANHIADNFIETLFAKYPDIEPDLKETIKEDMIVLARYVAQKEVMDYISEPETGLLLDAETGEVLI